jgi:hypothetical protein
MDLNWFVHRWAICLIFGRKLVANYLAVIRQFVNGKISLSQLSDYVDERLFDLRRDPDSISKEQEVLSGIELLICEINDGFRDIAELKEYTRSLISSTISIK